MEKRFIIADVDGKELGFLNSENEIDMELGGANDFELKISMNDASIERFEFGNRIYIQGSEYGGIIGDMETVTAQNIVKITGDTWRGLLDKKIIEPQSGQNYLTVSGELNDILRDLIDGRFDGLFLIPEVSTGVNVSSFKFDRYCTLLHGIEELLASVGYRLEIRQKRGEAGRPAWIELQAVKAKTLKKEYNQDNRINFTARDYRRGINHLICAGSGEGADRMVLHLYVQQDGSIGDRKYYTGLDERVALYSYTSQSDMEQLRKDGIKQLKSLQNYKQFAMQIDGDANLEIGDIVAGKDYTTGIYVQKPVVRKILKISDENLSIEYRLKGDE